jgi:polyhydroxyalkanoate synthase
VRDGGAQVYCFRRPDGAPAAPRRPVLLVPSMINRWYVLDLRAGSSFVEGLVNAGHDVYLLDWGVPRDEDRYLTWAEVIDRLARVVRFVLRDTGADRTGILGYCMGATLSTIYTALNPERVAALVNLAGPIDFSHAGFLGHMVDRRWFDPAAIAAAGNVQPVQMQNGLQRRCAPRMNISKIVGYVDRMGSEVGARRLLRDGDLGQRQHPVPRRRRTRRTSPSSTSKNALVRGDHRVRGRVAEPRRTSPARSWSSARSATPSARCPPPAPSTSAAAATTPPCSPCPAATSALW